MSCKKFCASGRDNLLSRLQATRRATTPIRASMNDGFFVVDMRGYPDPTQAKLPDFPASFHNKAGGMSFADGHSEIKRWLDPRTMPPVKRTNPPSVSQANNPDVIWLWQHTTSLF